CGHEVALFDARTGALVRLLVGHTAGTLRGDFSPDGKRFACGSMTQAIKVWDVGTGQEELTLNGHRDHVFGVAFAADGKRLASAGGEGIKGWGAADGREVQSLEYPGKPHHAVFGPDGSSLVAVGHDNLVKVWDLKTGQLTHTLEGHTGRVLTAVFSREGSVL